MLRSLLSLLTLAAVGPAAVVAAAPAAPVVVELFTSQGCSSCPPADAVLERLARQPGVVAVSRPVTYWDRLGWKDTLAREANTALQRRYAARQGGDRVYTPQAVVQGDRGLVGSREADLRKLVAATSRRPGPSLSIAGNLVRLHGTAKARASVTLLALRSSVPVRIGRGENTGRLIRYTNVVAAERSLGTWSGGPARFAIPAEALRTRGADRHALIVQVEGGGPILAARYL